MLVKEADHQLFHRVLEEFSGAVTSMFQYVIFGLILKSGFRQFIVKAVAAQLDGNNRIAVAVENLHGAHAGIDIVQHGCLSRTLYHGGRISA